MKTNKIALGAALFFAFLLIPWHASQAFEVKVDNSVNLNQGEMADGNVYASCNEMKIDGVVNGDVAAVCKTITINGVINGDLLAISDSVTVNGQVKGSVRTISNDLNINGQIDHNINAFGTRINLAPNSHIGWDVLLAGVNGNFGGNIDGNLHGYITSALISGKIAKNIDLKIDDTDGANGQGGLLVTKDAVVGGSLNYSAKKEARIESPSSVTGGISRQAQKDSVAKPADIISSLFYRLASLFLIGLIIVSLKKKAIPEIANLLEKKNWQSALSGLAIFFIAPLVSLILIFTVIGIPLALIIIAAYLIMFLTAIIITSFAVGRLIGQAISKKINNPFLILAIGLFIFTILAALPYLGVACAFVFIIYGLGALTLTIKNKLYD